MKSWLTRFLPTLWLALALTSLPALRAAASAEPAEAKPETPAPAPAAVAPETPATPEKVQAATEETAKPETEKAVAPATDEEKSVSPDDEQPKAPEPATPPAKGKKSKTRVIGYDSHNQHSGNERVSIFHNSTLAAGEKSGAVVSIIGSSTSAGDVDDVVLSVLGSSTSSGHVGNGVVSIVGNTRVDSGTVGDAAVAVLGNNYVNGHVGTVVAVLGNVELGPDAVVDQEVICVGGDLIRDPKAVVHGNVQNIAIGGHHFNFDGIHAWFEHCVLYARPLAFGPNLAWAWCIGFLFLALYALIALVAPVGVEKCVSTLEERPGKSILAALLTLLLTPVAFVLLALTIVIAVGVVLIPLFSLGLFFASIFGKVVMLAWLGRRLTKLFGDGPLTKPVFSVLVGGAIVLLLYTVPILGFVLYKLLGVLGLGVVVYTLLLQLKSSRAAAASRAAATAATAAAARQAAVPPAIPGDVPPPVIPALPPVISAVTLPRAGFWRRFGATLLDLIMVGIALAMLKGMFGAIFRTGGSFPVWFVIYNVAMWAIKGTTIGGIILGLKVVRLDDRPLDWSIAAVRGLSAFLSLAAFGLGFIWVAFDDEKQSWHDKIAGTTIVIVPKGTPLL